MYLFFVYLSMAYRVYSRSRVHMSIVSGIQRESGVFDNPIRFDCDRYIRVWTKSCFRFPLLSPLGVSCGGERERPQCQLLSRNAVRFFVFVLRCLYISILIIV